MLKKLQAIINQNALKRGDTSYLYKTTKRYFGCMFISVDEERGAHRELISKNCIRLETMLYRYISPEDAFCSWLSLLE